jgi:hypothetical protein
LWGLAGLYEAARLAERTGGPAPEIWAAFDDLKQAVEGSVRFVLSRQREQGDWETYVPTGPGDIGGLDSTMIGALAYFHPCRLHDGPKLGADVDQAFRLTLDTIWGHFVRDGGFRHDKSWNAYGPYLTLQLAHAFLAIGDVDRMDACLSWAVDAAFARVRRTDAPQPTWQVASGGWNEQHAYPVAHELDPAPAHPWYMGDMPHGWGAAELVLLLRDILLFEGGEDGDPHLYLAAGVPAHWLVGGAEIGVDAAPTAFGVPLTYRLAFDGAQTLELRIDDPPPGVRFVLPVRLGPVVAVEADGVAQPVTGRDVWLPPGTRRVEVRLV